MEKNASPSSFSDMYQIIYYWKYIIKDYNHGAVNQAFIVYKKRGVISEESALFNL